MRMKVHVLRSCRCLRCSGNDFHLDIYPLESMGDHDGADIQVLGRNWMNIMIGERGLLRLRGILRL